MSFKNRLCTFILISGICSSVAHAEKFPINYVSNTMVNNTFSKCDQALQKGRWLEEADCRDNYFALNAKLTCKGKAVDNYEIEFGVQFLQEGNSDNNLSFNSWSITSNPLGNGKFNLIAPVEVVENNRIFIRKKQKCITLLKKQICSPAVRLGKDEVDALMEIELGAASAGKTYSIEVDVCAPQ